MDIDIIEKLGDDINILKKKIENMINNVEILNRENICAECGKNVEKFKCSRCKKVWYCNIECQQIHWNKVHRLTCISIRDTNSLDISISKNNKQNDIFNIIKKYELLTVNKKLIHRNKYLTPLYPMSTDLIIYKNNEINFKIFIIGGHICNKNTNTSIEIYKNFVSSYNKIITIYGIYNNISKNIYSLEFKISETIGTYIKNNINTPYYGIFKGDIAIKIDNRLPFTLDLEKTGQFFEKEKMIIKSQSYNNRILLGYNYSPSVKRSSSIKRTIHDEFKPKYIKTILIGYTKISNKFINKYSIIFNIKNNIEDSYWYYSEDKIS